MIEQHGDRVVVQGKQLLGELYRAVLNHIGHRHANGAPSDDLRQAAKMLYRAYEMSPLRHELAPRATFSHARRVRTTT